MKTKHSILIALHTSVCALFCVPLASGKTLESIAVEHQAKLEKTVEAIKKQRAQILEERLPMARELKQLEKQAVDLREEVGSVQRHRDSMKLDLDELRTRVEAQRKELDYIRRSLAPDYLASWDAELSVGLRANVGEKIRRYHLFQEEDDLPAEEKLMATLELLMESFNDLESSFGGRVYDGHALDDTGKLQETEYAQLGPLLYAWLPSSQSGGELLAPPDAKYPRLMVFDKAAQEGIGSLVQSGSGKVPVDPTLGDAMALEQTKDTLLEHLGKGGVWVYPIVAFALLSTIVAIFKFAQVFRIRNSDMTLVYEIVKKVREDEIGAAKDVVSRMPEPTRGMLMAAVDHAGEPVELVEEVMYERILATQPGLERFLNVIAVTAATAPLLGLLGTVTGIIKTFELMGVYGAGDPKPLISGISEALITTELGLVLAIPALILHALLSRRVAGILSSMEKTALALTNGLTRRSGN